MESIVPIPSQGRTFVESRRVRLTDMDSRGRLRLDAVARFLQEIAIDDVDETGWGAPDHLWFVRRMRVDVREPLDLGDRLELAVTGDIHRLDIGFMVGGRMKAVAAIDDNA